MRQLSKSAARITLLLVLTLVITSLALPIDAVDFLRSDWRWLGHSAVWIEGLAPGIDMDHLAAFAVLGCAMRLGWSEASGRKVAAVLGLLAVMSEIMQFWVPGRTPLASDAALDLAGSLLGYAAAALTVAGACSLARSLTSSVSPKHSSQQGQQ